MTEASVHSARRTSRGSATVEGQRRWRDAFPIGTLMMAVGVVAGAGRSSVQATAHGAISTDVMRVVWVAAMDV
jgi:hypothetical protein